MDLEEISVYQRLFAVQKPLHDGCCMKAEDFGQSDHPCAKEGFDLMGAAFEVHRVVGGGLLEEIYQESLELEMGMRDLPFQRKQELQLHYKGRPLKKTYIPDLLVAEQIVVELKSVSTLLPEHEAQLLNYMRIARKPVGYLINFGPITKVQWKRFVLSEFLG